MRTIYDPELRAHITYDDSNRVRSITHAQPPAEAEVVAEGVEESLGAAETVTARDVAMAYVERFRSLLQVPAEQLESMGESPTNIAPQERAVQYHVSQEKVLFDATTVGLVQTVHDLPVWGSGMRVVVKHGPYQVVGADDTTSESDPSPALPAPDVIDRYQQLFATAEAEEKARETRKKFGDAGMELNEAEAEPRTADFVRNVFGTDGDVYVIRGRFFVFRYDPNDRLPDLAVESESGEETTAALPFDLPPVPGSVEPWAHYVVAEITFSHRNYVWMALVELETAAVLYLRPMFASVNGFVFLTDPLTATGVATNSANQPNSVLNPLRTSVQLRNLAAPVNNVQSLRGTRARLSDQHLPTVAAPTRTAGQNFDFDVRTNDFAAVSAYYHVDEFFRVVESLGFPLNTYFNDTTFPIDVDHRAHISDSLPQNGLEINAHCVSNGHGGIGHVCYALCDTTDTANPLGRACDSRVTWHELGGHGVLYEHVNFANFKFAHSAGDSLSAIFHAPESRVPAAETRRYAPWIASNSRRNDREPAAGWAWGGPKDIRGYDREEILASTLFRAYLAIGGASPDLPRRRFASRMMMYLILRAIGTLTPATNPDHPVKFANALIAVDLADWTTERVTGGAYGKVIRWAFEKQGCYQPPPAPAPNSVMTAGAPPDVDVYIDDGRGGEYQFQPDHAATTSIWNRHAPDGLLTHQQPRLGVTNHAYVKIMNRGPNAATGVRVRGFHSRPGANTVWPTGFQPMTTPAIAAGPLAGNNAAQQVVGPFAWTPVRNAAGGSAMLMIVTDTLDPSNADIFTPTRTIEDWRLVPNDNNIGQRNVQPV